MTRPAWLAAPAALGAALLALPLVALIVRVPWARVPALLAAPESLDALRVSLLTCLASLALTVLLGLPLAVLLARATSRWARALGALVTAPMVLPPVVAGLALLVALGRQGVLGRPLAAVGVQIGFTPVAVVLAQTFVSMPYFVVAVEGALRTLDPGYELLAGTLGATPTRTLAAVTLPLLAPALLGGAAMAFARALGEFGATLTFAGSLPGVTQTLPQAIYLARDADQDSALALAVLLLLIAVALMGVTGVANGRTHRA